MLQALFKNKLGRAIQEGSFHVIEDTLTSSAIGLLQYLPDELFWKTLREACGSSMYSLPEEIGHILGVHFWERMDADGTYNTQSVEPDVWIETEHFDILIEAKVSDSSSDNSQSSYQWFNEIVALANHYGNERDRGLVFIAMGGNESLRTQTCTVNGEDITIYTASWYDLLAAVLKIRKSCANSPELSSVLRLLDDIVMAMQYHHIISTVWFDSMLPETINPDARSFLEGHWFFDNKRLLASLTDNETSIAIESLSDIWKTV